MPEIQYYVVRQDEAKERFVPLIPVDQLPDWLDVVGVPREVQAQDATKMTALLDIGRKGGLGGTFKVRLLMDSPGSASSESDAGAGHAVKSTASTASPAAASEASAASAASVTSAPSSHDATGDEACDSEHDAKQAHARTDKTAHIDPIKESSNTDGGLGCWKRSHLATTPFMAKDAPETTAEGSPSDIHENQRMKPHILPCKYWCKHGRCGFNIRCRFAHIMPLTREGLRAVDLDELPPWYLKKQSSGQGPDKKKGLPVSPGGIPTASSKLHKMQKATAATASWTTSRQSSMRAPVPSKTYKPMPAIPAVEVDNLIDLI